MYFFYKEISHLKKITRSSFCTCSSDSALAVPRLLAERSKNRSSSPRREKGFFCRPRRPGQNRGPHIFLHTKGQDLLSGRKTSKYWAHHFFPSSARFIMSGNKCFYWPALPVVLYWCETWSLTLREEKKLRVFENMVLRKIFGRRKDEVREEWRRLHNEELNDLYSSPNIVQLIKSRRMRWAGHVARMVEEKWGIEGLGGEIGGKEITGET